jgi:hypothetical protein
MFSITNRNSLSAITVFSISTRPIRGQRLEQIGISRSALSEIMCSATVAIIGEMIKEALEILDGDPLGGPVEIRIPGRLILRSSFSAPAQQFEQDVSAPNPRSRRKL